MQLRINPEILKQFPEVLLGVIVMHSIDNHGEVDEINQLLRKAEKDALEKISSVPVSEHPNVIPWREVYRKFGAKPKDYPSSIENLIKRIGKGEQVRHINKLVDIYNIISLRYLLPVGGEDTDKINGDVELTFAGDNEKDIFLLGEKKARAPHPGEVIYKDNNGAICRRWNWKEADRTKLTEETTNAFMVLEALPPVKKEELEKATTELASLILDFCDGEMTTTILDKSNITVEIK